MLRYLLSNIVHLLFILFITFISVKGMRVLIADPGVIFKSVLTVIVANLIFTYIIRKEKMVGRVKIIKGGFIDRVKDVEQLKYLYLTLSLIAQVLIVSFAYSPQGKGNQKLVVFAVLLPLFLSSELLND